LSHRKSLADSSVFTSIPGFGANGATDDPLLASVNAGACISGNFASHHVFFTYLASKGLWPHEHCISRGFSPSDPSGSAAGDSVRPSVVNEILRLPDYDSFSTALQTGPAVAVPEWIHGDFGLVFTGPNDPLFFLHLVQLDRLWWIWQHYDAFKRFDEYEGRRRHDFEDLATLDDEISLGSLAPAVTVRDAMWGQWGAMCYVYV
jgi:tyrosinase